MAEDISLWEKDIPLFDERIVNVENMGTSMITPYLIEDGKTRGCILVFPGGGYSMRAEHEGGPVAEWLNSIGYHAFVVHYRVVPYKHPSPLIDGKRAVRFVRRHAERFHIFPDQIGVIGFSAGGHLAGCIATHYDDFEPEPRDEVDSVSGRPDLCILCYPVVTMKEFTHLGSRDNLIGDDKELMQQLSNEENIHEQMPPVFIWHTADDESVSVKNSETLAERLKEKGKECQLHVFPSGRHGLGLAVEIPEAAVWTDYCKEWIHKHFKN